MSDPKRIIIPTGYMGSGSSVITDLMGEIEGVDTDRGTFEYVFLHCPNGVFDLEDKLLVGNNAVRSDEAIHNFEKTMKQLYNKKYWWVGHYKDVIGEDFWHLTEEYIREITEVESDYFWYYQENTDLKMFFKLAFNKILKKASLGKFKPKKVLAYEPMRLSFIAPDRFYSLSKKYLYQVLNLAGYGEKSILFDQLLLPFNLFRFEKYFNEDAYVFVIERDPRDVFISNKYFWNKTDDVVPYPTDVNAYCKYYKGLREMEKEARSDRICRIKFEDLIYRYDETVAMIFEKLGWDPSRHTGRKTKFDPARSIFNTQLYLKDSKFKEEAEIIAENLKEYLYRFPYEIEHKKNEVF